MTRLLLSLVITLAAGSVARPQGPPPAPAARPQAAVSVLPADSLPATESVYLPADPAPAPRFWANAEYVFWTIGTGRLVDLGATSYKSDQFNALLAAYGKDYGDYVRYLLGDDRTGFRLNAGAWLDDNQTVGVEASFLYVDRAPLVLSLGRRDQNPLNSTLGALGLPGLDAGGRLDVIPFGRRDLADGSITIEIADQTLWVLDLGGRVRLFGSEGLTADGLIGYRRVYYRDSLAVRSEATTLAPPLLPGTRLQSADLIRAENTYDGVLFGVDLAAKVGSSWTVALRPTATLAYYRTEVTRAGATTVAFPDDRPRLGIAAGTYLRSSDVGTFTTSGWTVLPELGLRAARAFGDNVRLTLGTSLLYLPEVARAGPQFDLGLDPARVLPGSVGTRQGRDVNPPEMRSAFLSTFTVGLELRF